MKEVFETETGNDLEKAAKWLRQGQLVAIPTETVYGLAANALDANAALKIFETKNRPSFDPLIVHLGSLSQVGMVCETPPALASELMEQFWPGPLTIVLPKNKQVPDVVTAGLTSVGIRMPRHQLTHSLLKQLDFPLAAPSANPFGYVSPTQASHVLDQLGGKIPYILDGGPCEVGVESTIISFTGAKPIVLRLGGLPIEEIEKITGHLEVQNQSTSNPQAPGMLSAHYSPGKKVLLGDIAEMLKVVDRETTGVISFRKSFGIRHEYILSEEGDLREAARNLFAALRWMDKSEVNLVLAEYVPNEGLGRAMNDRLKRAAAKG